MPGLLAIEIELSGMITLGLLILTGGGIALGFILWKARQIYMKLQTGEEKRQHKSEAEESDIREQLLNRYKELYNLDKAQYESQIADLRREISGMKDEIRRLNDSIRNTDAELNELRDLNRKLQVENQSLRHELNGR